MVRKLVLLITKDTLESLYQAMIFGVTASSEGIETHIYFTFFGINALVKDKLKDLKMSVDYKSYEKTLKEKFKEMNVPTIGEMIKNAKEAGAKIYACETTMKAFNLSKENLIEEVDKVIGASEFLELSSNSDLSLTF